MYKVCNRIRSKIEWTLTAKDRLKAMDNPSAFAEIKQHSDLTCASPRKFLETAQETGTTATF